MRGELVEPLKNTLPMIALGTLFAIVFGTLTGVVSAWRRDTVLDKGRPLDVARLLLDADAVARPAADPLRRRGRSACRRRASRTRRWASSGTRRTWDVVVDRLRHMILPALTLGLVLYGDYALIMRSAMLETLGEDYVLTARAKGLSQLGDRPQARPPQRAAADRRR